MFNKTNKSKINLLRYIIDEGLACYINEIFWGEKYSSLDYIVFDKIDWNWAIENEKKIFQYSKELLDSEDYEIINKFLSWGESIWEGAPYRLGYFIGYRIIKAYIEKYGEDSLKELYTMNCNLILEKSDYETILK
ncbi:MAG: hypothetical protein JXA68_08715 [Ignavibacteriales bacterium]|nr:hypothetical protein [Ignavibacteriales bacterium]